MYFSLYFSIFVSSYCPEAAPKRLSVPHILTLKLSHVIYFTSFYGIIRPFHTFLSVFLNLQPFTIIRRHSQLPLCPLHLHIFLHPISIDLPPKQSQSLTFYLLPSFPMLFS